MDENLSAQVEEIETLCSIYGPDWVTVDEARRSYSITIAEDKRQVSLYVTLPSDYPSGCAPVYELFAPELSGDMKLDISAQLSKIYVDNAGDAILFQWIEKLREVLRTVDLQKKAASSVPVHETVQITRNEEQQERASCIVQPSVQLRQLLFTHGPVISDRKSTFQGHVAVVSSVEEVKRALAELMETKKVANATHNILAYRIERSEVPGSFLQDCDDDGETNAGTRLLHLLQVVAVVNVVVIVSRWYGGIQLGPDRFRHINNAARQVLDSAGLIAVKNKPSH